MYEEFYELNEKPFSLTPDPRFFFLSENHREAFEHLLYGIREKEGFILITGEVGTGKTTLCRTLLTRIESQATDTALIFNPLLSEQELLQCILSDFGIRSKATTKKGLLDELNQFLLHQQAVNRHSVLIIDEAQALSLPVLEEIRILSNLETEKEKLLQIILVGQVELAEQLALPRLRQLNQRISIRYRLRPLRKEEVPRYIQHRLLVAGASGAIHFSPGALKQIYRYSQGIPRLINLACDRALLAGYAEQRRDIQRATVSKGLKSLEGRDLAGPMGLMKKRAAMVFAAVAIFCLGVAAAGFLADTEWLFFRAGSQGSVSASSGTTFASLDKAHRTPFYTVQLGSYKTKDDVLEVAQRVKGTGYPLFLNQAKDAGTEQHQIFIGKFQHKSDAEEVAETFRKAKGFPGIKVILTTSMVSEADSP